MWIRTPRSAMDLGFQGLSKLWKWPELSAMVLPALVHSFLQNHILKKYVLFFFTLGKHIYLKPLSCKLNCELQC